MKNLEVLDRSFSISSDLVRPLPMPEIVVSDTPIRTSVLSRETNGPRQNFIIGQPLTERPTEEQLFVALAEAKIWTSRVAMHLDRDVRDRLFRQMDVLHEAEEWEADDRPVNLSSYKSLVRAIIHHKINSRPSLALMPDGNLLALWQDGADRLTVEFLPENRTRWLVQNESEDGPERVSGTSPLERLRAVLAPFGANRWFDGP